MTELPMPTAREVFWEVCEDLGDDAVFMNTLISPLIDMLPLPPREGRSMTTHALHLRKTIEQQELQRLFHAVLSVADTVIPNTPLYDRLLDEVEPIFYALRPENREAL